jgi:hypothetical protein
MNHNTILKDLSLRTLYFYVKRKERFFITKTKCFLRIIRKIRNGYVSKITNPNIVLYLQISNVRVSDIHNNIQVGRDILIKRRQSRYHNTCIQKIESEREIREKDPM